MSGSVRDPEATRDNAERVIIGAAAYGVMTPTLAVRALQNGENGRVVTVALTVLRRLGTVMIEWMASPDSGNKQADVPLILRSAAFFDEWRGPIYVALLGTGPASRPLLKLPEMRGQFEAAAERLLAGDAGKRAPITLNPGTCDKGGINPAPTGARPPPPSPLRVAAAGMAQAAYVTGAIPRPAGATIRATPQMLRALAGRILDEGATDQLRVLVIRLLDDKAWAMVRDPLTRLDDAEVLRRPGWQFTVVVPDYAGGCTVAGQRVGENELVEQPIEVQASHEAEARVAAYLLAWAKDLGAGR